MPREAVEAAEQLWRERHWYDGIVMPNGETVTVTYGDLMHAIVDNRIWRKPWRIEIVLSGVYEIRSAERDQRYGLSRWVEGGRDLVGYAILTPVSQLKTIHVVVPRKIRKIQRERQLLWRQ